MGRPKYCYNYTEEIYDLVNRLLQRFARNIECGSEIVKWNTLSDIINIVSRTKQDAYCNTISEKYKVVGYNRDKVGLSWEIIRQAKMYANFG